MYAMEGVHAIAFVAIMDHGVSWRYIAAVEMAQVVMVTVLKQLSMLLHLPITLASVPFITSYGMLQKVVWFFWESVLIPIIVIQHKKSYSNSLCSE